MLSDPYLVMLKKLLNDQIKSYPIRIYLFGSRAKGNAHSKSDVDIAILPLAPLPSGFMSRLKEVVEESTIPYSIDLVNISDIDPVFREKILAEGIVWND